MRRGVAAYRRPTSHSAACQVHQHRQTAERAGRVDRLVHRFVIERVADDHAHRARARPNGGTADSTSPADGLSNLEGAPLVAIDEHHRRAQGDEPRNNRRPEASGPSRHDGADAGEFHHRPRCRRRAAQRTPRPFSTKS